MPDSVSRNLPSDSERALIPVAPRLEGEALARLRFRPSAAFIAQLIAAAQHAPQARARRRTAPAKAAALYAAASYHRPRAVERATA